MISFASWSGSNKHSCLVPAIHVKRSKIRGEEDEMSQNKIEENHVVGWSSKNLHDGVNDALPIGDEYE